MYRPFEHVRFPGRTRKIRITRTQRCALVPVLRIEHRLGVDLVIERRDTEYGRGGVEAVQAKCRGGAADPAA